MSPPPFTPTPKPKIDECLRGVLTVTREQRDAALAEVARLTAEVKAGSELLALVAQSIVEASDLINADPFLSQHFTETARTFAEIVEFAREHAEKPSGALGALDDRWLEINRLDRADRDAEIGRLTARLKFYAEPSNHRKTVRWGRPKSAIDDDGGFLARSALQPDGEK